MKNYVVIIQNVVTQEMISTICKNKDELATLISNLNTDQYVIDTVQGITNVIDNIDHFCTTNANLETGN